jgi:hypothetical protein
LLEFLDCYQIIPPWRWSFLFFDHSIQKEERYFYWEKM